MWQRCRMYGPGAPCMFSAQRYSAWGSPPHTHTAPHGRKAFCFVLDPLRLGALRPFGFLGAGGPFHAPPWGKNLARMGACGLEQFSQNFLTRGAGCKESTRMRTQVPVRPSVPPLPLRPTRFFTRFLCRIAAPLCAGAAFAITSHTRHARPVFRPCVRL